MTPPPITARSQRELSNPYSFLWTTSLKKKAMYGAIDQMPNVLKKRVVKTQKKSRSRRGARAETTSWIRNATTTATIAAPAPRKATTNHQTDTGASSTYSRAASATAKATPAIATRVGTRACIAERM